MYQNCISLRKASISDLAILQKWDEEPHVIESDPNDDWQWEHCFASLDVKAILIDPLESNERAHRFYERLGFQFLEKRQFGEDRCFVYQLNRDNWELTKN
jgi:hypothetical protein